VQLYFAGKITQKHLLIKKLLSRSCQALYKLNRNNEAFDFVEKARFLHVDGVLVVARESE
jgi:hypothetical protein